MAYPDSEPNTEILGSVSKALDVLEAFSHEHSEMALGEIALKLNMGKSTVHKLLQTLLVRGFVAQDSSTRRYRLGLRNWQLGNLAVGSIDVREVAAPYMRHLAALTGEQLTLWVYETGWAVCVDRVDSRHRVRNYTRMGTVEKPEDFASGRCLLAFSGDVEIANASERLLRARGEYAADILRKRLETIRERGYETNPGDLWEEIRAIAAPLFGHLGVVGAISVSGPESRFDEGAIKAMLPHLLEVTREASIKLGYIPDGPSPPIEWSA
ncbi:MAG: IclR family transcriptional regulator [Acidimicrobiaceae bacterium]|nr:IclR family transcriptional regulator [Acidimicrobiaceae bacterium]